MKDPLKASIFLFNTRPGEAHAKVFTKPDRSRGCPADFVLLETKDALKEDLAQVEVYAECLSNSFYRCLADRSGLLVHGHRHGKFYIERPGS